MEVLFWGMSAVTIWPMAICEGVRMCLFKILAKIGISTQKCFDMATFSEC